MYIQLNFSYESNCKTEIVIYNYDINNISELTKKCINHLHKKYNIPFSTLQQELNIKIIQIDTIN